MGRGPELKRGEFTSPRGPEVKRGEFTSPRGINRVEIKKVAKRYGNERALAGVTL